MNKADLTQMDCAHDREIARDVVSDSAWDTVPNRDTRASRNYLNAHLDLPVDEFKAEEARHDRWLWSSPRHPPKAFLECRMRWLERWKHETIARSHEDIERGRSQSEEGHSYVKACRRRNERHRTR